MSGHKNVPFHSRLTAWPGLCTGPVHCIFTSRIVELNRGSKQFQVFVRNVSTHGTFVGWQYHLRVQIRHAHTQHHTRWTTILRPTTYRVLQCIMRLRYRLEARAPAPCVRTVIEKEALLSAYRKDFLACIFYLYRPDTVSSYPSTRAPPLTQTWSSPSSIRCSNLEMCESCDAS